MIIKYIKGQSPLHRLNPLSKLAATVVFSLAIFLIDNLAFQVCALAALVSADCAIGSRKLRAFLFSRWVLGLAGSIFAMQLLFTSGGSAFASIHLLGIRLALTDLGIFKGMLMMLRFLNVAMSGGVFVSTTEPVALVYGLMQAGVPYRYGFMLVTMMRFVPLFEAESATIANAQKMRGLELDTNGARKLLLSVRHTILPLTVSTLAKAEILALSMEGRAFGCRETRTFLKTNNYSFADRALITAAIAALILLLACCLTGMLSLSHLIKNTP